MRLRDPAVIELDLTVEELMENLDAGWRMWQRSESEILEPEPGTLEAA